MKLIKVTALLPILLLGSTTFTPLASAAALRSAADQVVDEIVELEDIPKQNADPVSTPATGDRNLGLGPPDYIYTSKSAKGESSPYTYPYTAKSSKGPKGESSPYTTKSSKGPKGGSSPYTAKSSKGFDIDEIVELKNTPKQNADPVSTPATGDRKLGAFGETSPYTYRTYPYTSKSSKGPKGGSSPYTYPYTTKSSKGPKGGSSPYTAKSSKGFGSF